VTSFKRASIEEVIPLRHRILRKGRPIETASFAEDHFESTLHFGLYNEHGNIICCLMMTPNLYKGLDAWQLRGMATDEKWQGKGIGSELVKKSIAAVQEISKKSLLWCNARESAVGFYEKLGWKIDSELFTIEPIGPHYKMIASLL
jgi:predicted GNAT family N-acyltransferase